jgi:GGDEF domain-containing protein
MMLDLDQFKKLNDTLGHEMGDKLLVQVGRRLRDTMREADTVARLGGDEFVIIIENLGSNEPWPPARRADCREYPRPAGTPLLPGQIRIPSTSTPPASA